jgi:hypothetical protein
MYFLHRKSKSKLSYSQSTSLSWCQATIKARHQFSFLVEIFLRLLPVCYFMAPSLTRGRVCNLLLLLHLARAALLDSEFRGTQGHILLSQYLRLPQPEGPGSRIYIPQGQGGPVTRPGAWFAFRSLLRFTGLGWRYFNPPPQGISTTRFNIILRPTVSRPVYLRVRHASRT